MTRPSPDMRDAAIATTEDVRHLAGDIDGSVIAAILEQGATYREVELAAEKSGGEAEGEAARDTELDPIARAVRDILMADPIFNPPVER